MGSFNRLLHTPLEAILPSMEDMHDTDVREREPQGLGSRQTESWR